MPSPGAVALGPIATHLAIPLPEIHDYLRLDPEVFATVGSVPAGGKTFKLDRDISEIRLGDWVTIRQVDAKVVDISYPDRDITLDRAISDTEQIAADTRVDYHHQNALMVQFRADAMSRADRMLDNPFHVLDEEGELVLDEEDEPVVEIPPEVRVWVLSYIARLMVAPELGLLRESTRETGSRQFEQDLYQPIEHLIVYKDRI